MKTRFVSLFTLIVLVSVPYSLAQTPTGTLQGTVSDTSGAVVAGASVRITNQGTNQEKELKTDGAGRYVLPFVAPGSYTITVQAIGFQQVKEDGIKVDVAQNRSVDFRLSVGQISQQVEVSASAPPLDVNTSTVGQVIDNKKVVDLPLNGRNPFDLAALSPGVSTVGGASTPHIGGSRNANNEQQIDGVTNITPENNVGNNGTAYQPIVDSVQEFSVQINALSAEYGRFGGGVINVVTKSGTNQLHGSGFEFARNAVLDANDFFANRAGASKPDMKRNQFGGTVGGPIVIPHLYDGHDRTFFFFGYEGTRETDLATATNTVPLAAWRQGDFSGLGQLIYDPLTAHQDASGNYVRNPFPGNTVPTSRFDPVAVAALSYYPAPNTGGPAATVNNLFTVGNNTGNVDRWDTRIDHGFTQNWKMFLRFSHSWGEDKPLQDYGNIASQGWGGPDTNGAWSASMDHTISFSPTLVADLRYGLSRSSVFRYPYSQGFDITKLGFSQEFASVAAQRSKEFPRFDVSGTSGLGPNGWVHLIENPLVHQASGSLTKIMDRHTIKAGAEFRKLFLNFTQYGHPSGDFGFDPTWTQQVLNKSDGTGSSFASMLLGLPSYGSMTHEPTAADASSYMALYIQDDWKLTRTLTVNLGLRWEVEFPRTERYNQLSYWDPSVPSPLAGSVPTSACAYCGNLTGAMYFAGQRGSKYGRAQGPTQWKDFAPRVGIAWSTTPKMVIRSGFGIAYAPSALQAAGTSGAPGIEGFNTQTNFNGSFDNQRTIHAFLNNPFPDGFNLPKGAAGGALTDLGFGIGDSFFSSYRNPYSIQWNFNVQRELPGGMTLEASYIGNRGLFLVDGDPGTPFSQLPTTDLALGNHLYDLVPNPFYGIINIPGSPLSQPQIQYARLLRPFPQYDGVQSFRKPTASSMFHGVTLRLEKRFSNGVTFLVAFTGGKTMDDSASAVGYLGPTSGTRADQYNRRLEWSVSPQDVSKHFVTSFVYDLPFGRGKKLFNSAPSIANFLISGWQANGILTFGTGTPLIIGGAYNQTGIFTFNQRPDSNGHTAKLSHQSINEWFDTSVFSQPAPFTIGTTGRALPDVRNPGTANTDLSLFKNNYFGKENRYNVQFRTEWFNALNHTQFGSPDTNIHDGNFGVISGTAVSPRQIQMALKFIF